MLPKLSQTINKDMYCIYVLGQTQFVQQIARESGQALNERSLLSETEMW